MSIGRRPLYIGIMAKSGKSSPSKHSGKPHTPPQRAASPQAPKDWLSRPDLEAVSAPRLQKIFWGLAAFGLFLMIGLSFGSGTNADDKFQNDYSKKLVSYYSTFGADTSALLVPDGNMHYYGALFEIVTGFANKAFSRHCRR